MIQLKGKTFVPIAEAVLQARAKMQISIRTNVRGMRLNDKLISRSETC